MAKSPGSLPTTQQGNSVFWSLGVQTSRTGSPACSNRFMQPKHTFFNSRSPGQNGPSPLSSDQYTWQVLSTGGGTKSNFYFSHHWVLFVIYLGENLKQWGMPCLRACCYCEITAFCLRYAVSHQADGWCIPAPWEVELLLPHSNHMPWAILFLTYNRDFLSG